MYTTIPRCRPSVPRSELCFTGGFNLPTPLKNDGQLVTWDDDIYSQDMESIGKSKKSMVPVTTNQFISYQFLPEQIVVSNLKCDGNPWLYWHPFLHGITHVGDLQTGVMNLLLSGMILHVRAKFAKCLQPWNKDVPVQNDQIERRHTKNRI